MLHTGYILLHSGCICALIKRADMRFERASLSLLHCSLHSTAMKLLIDKCPAFWRPAAFLL